jgi:hypothetical protein
MLLIDISLNIKEEIVHANKYCNFQALGLNSKKLHLYMKKVDMFEQVALPLTF